MTRDVMLVSDEVLIETLTAYNGHATAAMVRAFAEAEPTLATFLSENGNRVVGKLALARASRNIVQGIHADLVDHLRRGPLDDEDARGERPGQGPPGPGRAPAPQGPDRRQG